MDPGFGNTRQILDKIFIYILSLIIYIILFNLKNIFLEIDLILIIILHEFQAIAEM